MLPLPPRWPGPGEAPEPPGGAEANGAQAQARRGEARGTSGVGWGQRLAPALAPLALLAGTAFFVQRVARLHPLGEWQSPRFLGYAAATVGWLLGCLSFGLRVDAWVRPGLRLSERLVMALTSGVVGCGLGLFGLGLGGLLWRPVFVALPVAMLASGAGPAWRLGRRVARHVGAARRRGVRPDTLAERVALGLGVVGVMLVLVPTFTAQHLGFDAGWYHLSMAEHYAAAHRVERFTEGWLLGAYPHLASVLYTWAALCPWGTAVDRTLLAGMMEVGLFVATLACMPVLARAMLGRSVRYAWAGLFLFPIVFSWDLEIGADHVAAFFAVPVMLALVRHEQAPGWRRGAGLAVAVAGVLLTKYSAYPVVVGPLAVAAVGGGRRAWRAARSGGGPGGLWAGGVRGVAGLALGVLVLTAPHWLANLVWYGDPLYPSLHRWLRPRPWTESAGAIADYYVHTMSTVHPPRSAAGVMEAGRALLGFSFEAHDYWHHHHDWPFVGSIFTLATLTLPWLGAQRRLWVLFGCLHVTVFLWYLQSHVERYLHAALPLFAVASVVVLGRVWRLGAVARAATVVAVGTQVAWGLSIFGLANFRTKVNAALSAAEASFVRDGRDLSASLRPWMDIARALPRRARPLLHDCWVHVGLERPSVSDLTGAQYGLAYGLLPTPRALHERLVEQRVTHLISPPVSREQDSLGGDLRYWDYEHRFGQQPRTIGGQRVVTMPAGPPPEEPAWGLVYVHTCQPGDPYRAGLHDLRAMNRGHLGGVWHGEETAPVEEASAASPDGQVARARFAVVRDGCAGRAPALVAGRLALLVQRGPYKLYGPR